MEELESKISQIFLLWNISSS